MIEGFLLGLSMGAFCLGWCLPAFLPYLLAEKRSLKEGFEILGKFLAGRFFGYLILGILVGYLGEKINSPILLKISFFSLGILGAILILYGFGKLKGNFKICQFFSKTKTPILLGFFLGFNICPPFISAIFYAISLKNLLLSVLFFISFFIGSSIYLILPVFLGLFSSIRIFQRISKISLILAGSFFLFFSFKNLFSPIKIFPCPFLDFYFPFLNYPIEIFLLIPAIFLAIFAFKTKKYFELRYLILLAFFFLAFFKFPQFCPFLTLKEIGLGRLGNIFSFSFFILILISTLIFGRIFCGWACPISFFQEVVFRIGRKIKKIPVIKIPLKFSYLKFLILILFLIFILLLKSPLCGKDPFGALFGFFRNPLSLILLFILFLFSLFIFLPFCRLFCPLGAILALFSKISIFQLKIEKESCKNCGVCSKSCLLQAISGNKISNSECMRCGQCLKECPFFSIKLKI